MSATRAEINLDAFASNLQSVRQHAPGCKILAVVKANAYGHGLSTAVAALGAADAFGVATVEEAIALRKQGYAGRIVVMSRIENESQMQRVVASRLWPVIHDAAQVDWLRKIISSAGTSGTRRVWIKVDTGMHRLGFTPDEVPAVAAQLRELGLGVDLLSHLSSADDPSDVATSRQLEVFAGIDAGDEPGNGRNLSMANSGGIVAFPASHFDWVRPGIMLYGCSPVKTRDAHSLGLTPVMTLRSSLISVRPHQAGESVGYAGTWTAERDTILGVVACGYADGYPRSAPCGSPVLVNGERVPLAGRVSMDTLVVDLGPTSTAAVGDPVVLWGDGLAVEEVAAAAGTISYDLLCRVGPRVARVVV